MTVAGQGDAAARVVVAEPELAPPFFPPLGGEDEAAAPRPLPWWQRHVPSSVVVVSLLAGSAGALVTDAVHSNPKPATIGTPATSAAPARSSSSQR